MTINKAIEGKVCILFIKGRIDTLTSPELEQEFIENAENCEKMIFDLSETEYISSAGLRVILVANREMEKKDGLVLRNLSKNVESIIRMTGFGKFVCIE